MAMGLGAFIAAALGMAATGAAAEVGRQKAEAKHEVDKITRELMIGALQKYAMTPGDFNPEVVSGMMSAAGIKGQAAGALVPVIGSMKQQATVNRAQTMQMMQGFMGGGQAAPGFGVAPGAAGPPPPPLPAGGAPLVPPPQGTSTPTNLLAAQMGSQGALAPATPFVGQPQGRLQLPATPQQGLGLAPAQMAAPPTPPPAPALPPSGAVAPMPRPRAGAATSDEQQVQTLTGLFPRTPPTGKVSSISWKDDMTGMTMTMHPADFQDPAARGRALAGIGAERGYSYRAITQAAIQSGATLPEGFDKKYGQMEFDRMYVQGDRPKSSTEAEERLWEAYKATGYMPDQMRQMLGTTREQQDNRYAETLQRARNANPNLPFDVLDQAVRASLGGIVPAPGVTAQLRAQAAAQIEAHIRAKNPNLSPAELEEQVQYALGGGVMTEHERARMDKPAELPADVREQRTIEGKPTLLERQIRPSVRPGQEPPEVEDLKATRERAAIGKGTEAARAREAAKTIDVVSKPTELNKYVDTTTGGPPTATPQADLDRGVKDGSLAMLLVPPTYFKDLRTLRDRLEEVRSIVNDPKGVYALSIDKRAALRAASGSMQIRGFTIPPQTWLRGQGITPHQAEQAGKLLAVHAFAIPMLRQFGEKGQGITGKAYAQSADVFPGFLDDQTSAANRLNEMVKWVDLDIQNSMQGPGAQRLMQNDADRRFKEKFGGKR